LIEKHIPNLSLDTIKKIAALKPGDPKALLILRSDPYFKKLGFADQFAILGALNKITSTYNDVVKQLKAELKKDGFSDAQITQVIDLMTQYMIQFALGTMEGLEKPDDTVSTGIISFTPLDNALLQLGYALRDNAKPEDVIKEMQGLIRPPMKEEKKEVKMK
jgi:hypothetical protein